MQSFTTAKTGNLPVFSFGLLYSWCWSYGHAILTRRTLQRILTSKGGKNCFLGEAAWGQMGTKSPACSNLHKASTRNSENSGSWSCCHSGGPKCGRYSHFSSHICYRTLKSFFSLSFSFSVCMWYVRRVYRYRCNFPHICIMLNVILLDTDLTICWYCAGRFMWR